MPLSIGVRKQKLETRTGTTRTPATYDSLTLPLPTCHLSQLLLAFVQALRQPRGGNFRGTPCPISDGLFPRQQWLKVPGLYRSGLIGHAREGGLKGLYGSALGLAGGTSSPTKDPLSQTTMLEWAHDCSANVGG